MYKEFTKKTYNAVIKEGYDIYRELFDRTEITDNTVDYWKTAINFYEKLDIEQRQVFFSIIHQIMVDTVSSIFGIIDGTSSIDGDYNIDFFVNGEQNECELQDSFLEYVEDCSYLR